MFIKDYVKKKFNADCFSSYEYNIFSFVRIAGKKEHSATEQENEIHVTNNNVKRHAPAVPMSSSPAVSVSAPLVSAVQSSTVSMTDDDKVKARVTLKDWEPVSRTVCRNRSKLCIQFQSLLQSKLIEYQC